MLTDASLTAGKWVSTDMSCGAYSSKSISETPWISWNSSSPSTCISPGGARMLHLVELPLGVVEVKLKVVELVLKKLERGVMVHHRVLKLLDLALELGDQSTPARKLVTGLTKLLVSQLDGQV